MIITKKVKKLTEELEELEKLRSDEEVLKALNTLDNIEEEMKVTERSKRTERLCPKCHKEINFITRVKTVDMLYYLSTDKHKNIHCEVEEFEPTDNDCFYCPECGEILFTEEAKAIAFLKGK